MPERHINTRRFTCSESIPAYSIAALTGTTVKGQGRRMVYEVARATATSNSFGATGRFDGSTGAINVSEDMLVRYSGTLAAGDRVRPVVGDWVVEKNSAGNFVVVGIISKGGLQLASIRLDPIKGGLRLIKAPSGGIPGRVGSLMGGSICDIVTFDANGLLTVSTDQIKVFNWSTSSACVNGDRYGIAGWVNSAWLIIAEDCNDEGSVVIPGSGGGTGGRVESPLNFSVTPASSVGVGNEVRYSGAGVTGGGFE